MFQAANMTYMRKREKEKAAAKRAVLKAEMRRQKMEELMAAAQENIEKVNKEEEEGVEPSTEHTEFYNVCNNVQTSEKHHHHGKRRSRKVVTASD